MQKMIAVILCVLLICSAAIAEVDEPALKNPKERYEIYFEQTDGSEQAVFMLVDGMNDEAADVEAHGSVIATHGYYMEGQVFGLMDIILQDSDYGRMIMADVMGSHTIYALDGASYIVSPGQAAERTIDFVYDDFDWYWESYHFPYGRLEMMHGIRTDEAGNTYMLVKCDETMTFEFAMGADMRIEQLRIYDRTGEDELTLGMVVDYSVGPAREIPDDVLALMQEDFSAQ